MLRAHDEGSTWSWRVLGKAGNTESCGSIPMRSFLTQYYALIECFMAGNVNSTITNTSGVGQTVGSNGMAAGKVLNSQGGAGVTNFGILVGTGTTANSGSTYSLATLVANGTSSGQLTYGSCGITTPSGTSPLSFTITRTLTNNSGASITINEVGLAIDNVNTAAADQYFLIVRDVLGTGVTVTNGSNITWTLTLSYTIA